MQQVLCIIFETLFPFIRHENIHDVQDSLLKNLRIAVFT